MKFTCDKSILLEGINSVLRAVPNKNSIQSLQGILLESDGSGLKFSATDLEIGIQRTIGNISVDEPGTILIPAKLFSDIIKKLPDTMISIETNGVKMRIDYFLSSIELSLFNPEKFPQMPEIIEGKLFPLPATEIKEALNHTLYAVSTDWTRPVFAGILFKMQSGKLDVVATDTHRLSLYSKEIESGEDFEVIIPGKTAKELQRLLKDQDTIIRFSNSQIVFEFGETKIFSRLIDGTFPNYSQVIPKDCTTKVKVNIADLRNSIERASLMTSDHDRKINLSIEHSMIITSESQGEGNVNEQLIAEIEGNPVAQSLNGMFLLDALKVFPNEDVTLEFNGGFTPLIMRDDNSISLILPMRR